MGNMEGIASLAISISAVLSASAPVWATMMASLGEVVRWAGDFFRAVLGLIIMLIPGIVFWLVVIGVIVIVQRWNTRRPVSDRTGQYSRKPEGNNVEGWENSIA